MARGRRQCAGVAAVVAAAGAGAGAWRGVAGQWAAGPGPFDPYLCRVQLADAAGNVTAYAFDTVAAVPLSVSEQVGKYDFLFVPCGIANYTCLPSDGAERWPYAPAVQVFSQTEPGGSCVNPATGASQPCSQMCEPLGYGPPLWSLLDATNASAGVQVTYTGIRATLGDPAQCPYDPALGTETPRTVQILHYCNASLPAGEIVALGGYESPPCNYVLQTASRLACGLPVPPGQAPVLPPPTTPPIPPTTNTSPFAPYLCTPALTDASGDTWLYNLTGLYAPGAPYTITNAAAGTTYTFNLCGYASSTCAPAWAVQYNAGVAVVSWGGATGPGPCYLVNHTSVPCTSACDVLGVGGPTWALADAADPLTGGLTLTYANVNALPDEPTSCPTNPVTGTSAPLSLTVNLNCDPSAPAGNLQLINAYESAPCAHVIVVATVAACGIAPPPPPSY